MMYCVNLNYENELGTTLEQGVSVGPILHDFLNVYCSIHVTIREINKTKCVLNYYLKC